MYTVLLPPIREPLLDDHWRNFLVLNGTYPNMAAAAAANASVPPTVSPYDVVKWSIQGWNASVWNTSSNSYMQSPTWPYPEGTKAQGWMSMVQQILQRCITDEEAVQLEADNLLDCSTLGRQRACASTCTDTVSGSLYFFAFTLVSAFVLMQLVIAVLLDQIMNSSEKHLVKVRCPGCYELRLAMFNRMYRRWIWAAKRKLALESRARRRAARAAAASISGTGNSFPVASPLVSTRSDPRLSLRLNGSAPPPPPPALEWNLTAVSSPSSSRPYETPASDSTRLGLALHQGP